MKNLSLTQRHPFKKNYMTLKQRYRKKKKTFTKVNFLKLLVEKETNDNTYDYTYEYTYTYTYPDTF